MPTLSLKPNVRLDKLTPQMVVGLMIAWSIYSGFGYDLTVTSGEDGTHSDLSKHYQGDALDLRTKHVPADKLALILATMKAACDNQYDVVLEGADTPGSTGQHIHLEYDLHY